MRGDAVFGDLVHGLRADLKLDALVLGTDDSGVDRAIIVLLRRGDVVLEAPRNEGPGVVNDAQDTVTIRDVAHHHPEAQDIRQLLEGDALALHLPPDGIGPLLASLHIALDSVGGEFPAQIVLDEGDDRPGA